MRILLLLLLIITISVSYPAEGPLRIKRGSTKNDHVEKIITTNGKCMKIVYDLKITDANPNARPMCTMKKCRTDTTERVACRTYFPDKPN